MALNKTFCPTQAPLTDWQSKYGQRTKINKTILSAFPHRFFTQSSLYQNSKASKYSILTVAEHGRPVSKSWTKILKFYAPTDSEHKFYKTGIAAHRFPSGIILIENLQS